MYSIILSLLAGYMALSVRVLGHYAVARTFKMSVHYLQFGRGPLLMTASMPGDKALCGFMLFPWCGDISVDYQRHDWMKKMQFHVAGAFANVAAAVMTVFVLQFLIQILGSPVPNGFVTYPDHFAQVPLQLLLVFTVANAYAFAFSFLPLPGTHTWEALRVYMQQHDPNSAKLMDKHAYSVLNLAFGVFIGLILMNAYA